MVKYTGLVAVILVTAAVTYNVCDRFSQPQTQLFTNSTPAPFSDSALNRDSKIVPLTPTTTNVSTRSMSTLPMAHFGRSNRTKSHAPKLSGSKPSAQLDLRRVPSHEVASREMIGESTATTDPAFLDLTGGLGLLPTAIVLPKAQETRVSPPIFDTRTQKKAGKVHHLNSRGQVLFFL